MQRIELQFGEIVTIDGKMTEKLPSKYHKVNFNFLYMQLTVTNSACVRTLVEWEIVGNFRIHCIRTMSTKHVHNL